MDLYFLAKALHLVSIVSWFAGLFYIGRLFIYHAEALSKPEAERAVLVPQYALMQSRVWKAILVPAALATLLTGGWLLYITEAWRLPWFHVKLVFLVLLFGYHDLCGKHRRDLALGKARTVRFYRFWNESATVLLFLIVFTAVLKRPMGAAYGLIAVLILTAVGMGVFLAKRKKANSR